ncbi:MAG: hypothetical protein NZ523_04015 [Elioraea sp.]|nr:hypothetical protein [Elioraea sp.]
MQPLFALALARILAATPARAEFQNFLSPGMSYDTMALANASFILSQAQQNAALQALAIDLGAPRSPPRPSARTPAPSAAPSASATAQALAATDFRPRRRASVAAQFADLSPDPAHRPALRALGQAVFDELEKHPEFRRNNLTYAVGMAIGAALAIERGRDLSDEESALVLATVHEFLTRGSDVTRRSAEEKTALYDTCLLFTGLMAVFEADAQANGHAETRAAARAVSRAVLTLFGFAEQTRR